MTPFDQVEKKVLELYEHSLEHPRDFTQAFHNLLSHHGWSVEAYTQELESRMDQALSTPIFPKG